MGPNSLMVVYVDPLGSEFGIYASGLGTGDCAELGLGLGRACLIARLRPH